MTGEWTRLGRAVVPESPSDPADRELAVLGQPLALLSENERDDLNEGLAEIARRRREVETELRLSHRY